MPCASCPDIMMPVPCVQESRSPGRTPATRRMPAHKGVAATTATGAADHVGATVGDESIDVVPASLVIAVHGAAAGR